MIGASGWLRRQWLQIRERFESSPTVLRPLPPPPNSASPSPPGTAPAPQESQFFERTRFEGRLSGHGHSVALGFDAWIDGLGLLHLELDSLPYSREAYALHIDQRPGSPVDLLNLTGTSAAGHRFSSDGFSISKFRHGSEPGQELSYQGDCYDAALGPIDIQDSQTM